MPRRRVRLAPEEEPDLQSLLGPPPVLEGEDASAYEALKFRILSAVKSGLGGASSLSVPSESTADKFSSFGSNVFQQLMARRIAQADLELRRIRKARVLLAKNPAQPPYDPIFDLVDELAEEPGLRPPPFRLRWEKLHLRQLHRKLHREANAFERYERRALSRRKFAMRDFDIARLATPNSGLVGD